MNDPHGQDGAVRVLTGLAQVDLPQAVARADRLFFHAAVYGNFADSPAMVAALDAALSRSTFAGLDVVSLDTAAPVAWRQEFFDVLREGLSPVDMLAAAAASEAFLAELSGRHPGKVRRYAARSLPLAPILLVGSAIFAGHYAHGPIPAPNGLWLVVPADVPSLLRRAEARIPPGPDDRYALAAYRFVRECVHARDTARRVA